MSNSRINKDLAEVRKFLEESFELEEDTETDELDSFMAQSARQLMSEVDVSEDEALDYLFTFAAAGNDQGILPEIPDTDATPEECAEWITAATEADFVAESVNVVKMLLSESD